MKPGQQGVQALSWRLVATYWSMRTFCLEEIWELMMMMEFSKQSDFSDYVGVHWSRRR